jgi:8-hydroxy-5-deazaflavin:NADPH oxidoreductase
MDVTIIGSGNMAQGIGTRLVAGGHAVTVLGTEAAKAQALATSLGGSAQAGTSGTDPLRGDVVVLAVPYAAAADALAPYADQLGGKVVVDITNPLNETFDGLVTPGDGSGAQEIAAALPEGTRVVKAFNTTFAGTLTAGEVAGQPLDVFVAGDDEEAKATVADLVRSGGLNPIDAGPLARARELEAIGFLHIALQSSLGTGFSSAVKVLV